MDEAESHCGSNYPGGKLLLNNSCIPEIGGTD
jgi:hypothetical protein